MPTLRPEAVEQLAARILEAAGSPAVHAAVVAESLTLSNLKGVDSHGLVRVEQYVDEIDAGVILPAAEPTAEIRGSVAVVDGGRGFGQVGAREATRLACELARRGGLGLAALARVQHVGRLGEYVERTAAGGFVGLAWCNTGPPGGRVAPFGGSRALLGTNPLAYGVPTSGVPLVSDFSTAATAEGRVRLARQTGARLPEGLLVDRSGAPTTRPDDLYEGGSILPAGGHRGTALALLAELLGGIAAGAGTASTGDDPGNGLVLLAIDPGALRPGGDMTARVDDVLEALRGTPAAPGVERVLAPGDLELETEARRRTEGIPVAEGTWRRVVQVADRLGVDV